MTTDHRLPAHAQPTTLDVPLYPRSAQALLNALLQHSPDISREPLYVQVDYDNLINKLRAHLQRVALGE